MLLCELEPMEYAITIEEAVVGDDYLSEDFFDYEFEDDFDEYGFNPYMGCYDFDCQSKSQQLTSRTYVRAQSPGRNDEHMFVLNVRLGS